jgi:cytochrome P450
MASDEEVRDQCMTIFLAGHETTATALTWWGYLMARHPDCAVLAAREVDTVLQGHMPGYGDLPQLVYLDQCLRECMRLYPPTTSLMTRRAVQDVQLGDWTIPKRAMLLLPVHTVQQDARWFVDPERFNPQRFAAENAAQIPRGAYMPFGTGPRVCLGQVFAMTEMTLIAAMILQRFTVTLATPDFDPQPTLNVTLRPAHGLPLRITRRTPLRQAP